MEEPAIALMADGRVRFERPDVAVDLGGIAKGFAVDRAIEVLRAQGISRALVNAGGDLAAFGPEPHLVHIRDPRSAAAPAHGGAARCGTRLIGRPVRSGIIG